MAAQQGCRAAHRSWQRSTERRQHSPRSVPMRTRTAVRRRCCAASPWVQRRLARPLTCGATARLSPRSGGAWATPVPRRPPHRLSPPTQPSRRQPAPARTAACTAACTAVALQTPASGLPPESPPSPASPAAHAAPAAASPSGAAPPLLAAAPTGAQRPARRAPPPQQCCAVGSRGRQCGRTAGPSKLRSTHRCSLSSVTTPDPRDQD
eukprot:354633-Chlamydomonas_euryale.AAC.7